MTLAVLYNSCKCVYIWGFGKAAIVFCLRKFCLRLNILHTQSDLPSLLWISYNALFDVAVGLYLIKF